MDAEKNEAVLRLGLHPVPAKDFPHLRALGRVLADYDGAQEPTDEKCPSRSPPAEQQKIQ